MDAISILCFFFFMWNIISQMTHHFEILYSYFNSHIGVLFLIQVVYRVIYPQLLHFKNVQILNHFFLKPYMDATHTTVSQYIKGILWDRRWIAPSIGIFSHTCGFVYRNAFLLMKLSNPHKFLSDPGPNCFTIDVCNIMVLLRKDLE